MYFIGIDLGTSSIKMLLVNETGKVVNTVSEEYPIYYPKPGFSEQNPQDWIKAVMKGIPRLLDGFNRNEVEGIGVAGQMHGLVILDENDEVIRPAILWNDGRTYKEVEYLNCKIGKDKLKEWTGNIAFAGFTAPKLLWLQENEPENFARIKKIMLPKDYINYWLTGVHSTDYSDASGMLLLDVKNKIWSQSMLDVCGISSDQLPDLFESYEITEHLRPEVSLQLGLTSNAFVIAGAGDNAAAAIGTGTVHDGNCNISLGTSGTIFIASSCFRILSCEGIHNFAHANGAYHLMGCMLSAASCNKWLYENIFKTEDYEGEQTAISLEKLGKNNVFFLPYLMGERSPVNDTDARGSFIGMTMDTSREDIVQAVLEGVSFALKDSIEAVKAAGVKIERSRVCGGGAKSGLWLKILANILNCPLELLQSEQGPGYGAAILAMTAIGRFTDPCDAADEFAIVREIIEPDQKLAQLYIGRYEKFGLIYPALKEVFKKM